MEYSKDNGDRKNIVYDIIRRQTDLETTKNMWTSQYKDLDNYSKPSPWYFNSSTPSEGQKDTLLLFDSTTPLGLHYLSSALISTIVPRGQKWHGLMTKRPELKKNFNVNLWLQQVTDILFDARYRTFANFDSQIGAVFDSLAKYGTACLFTDDVVGQGIRYKAIHLCEFFIAEDPYGSIDTVFCKFQLTAEQACQLWGDAAPQECKQKMKNKKPDTKSWFIHAVCSNDDYDEMYQGLSYKRMKYKSYYICADTKEFITEGGYRVMPYAVVRWKTNHNEIYGRSPAMKILPETKMANAIISSD